MRDQRCPVVDERRRYHDPRDDPPGRPRCRTWPSSRRREPVAAATHRRVETVRDMQGGADFGRACRRTRARAAHGSNNPASVLSRVDLPDPFTSTNAMDPLRATRVDVRDHDASAVADCQSSVETPPKARSCRCSRCASFAQNCTVACTVKMTKKIVTAPPRTCAGGEVEVVADQESGVHRQRPIVAPQASSPVPSGQQAPDPAGANSIPHKHRATVLTTSPHNRDHHQHQQLETTRRPPAMSACSG